MEKTEFKYKGFIAKEAKNKEGKYLLIKGSQVIYIDSREFEFETTEQLTEAQVYSQYGKTPGLEKIVGEFKESFQSTGYPRVDFYTILYKGLDITYLLDVLHQDTIIVNMHEYEILMFVRLYQQYLLSKTKYLRALDIVKPSNTDSIYVLHKGDNRVTLTLKIAEDGK